MFEDLLLLNDFEYSIVKMTRISDRLRPLFETNPPIGRRRLQLGDSSISKITFHLNRDFNFFSYIVLSDLYIDFEELSGISATPWEVVDGCIITTAALSSHLDAFGVDLREAFFSSGDYLEFCRYYDIDEVRFVDFPPDPRLGNRQIAKYSGLDVGLIAPE